MIFHNCISITDTNFLCFPIVPIHHVSSLYYDFLAHAYLYFSELMRGNARPGYENRKKEGRRGAELCCVAKVSRRSGYVCKPGLLQYFLGCSCWRVFLGRLTRMPLFCIGWAVSAFHSLAWWEWTLALFSLSPWSGKWVRSLLLTCFFREISRLPCRVGG